MAVRTPFGGILQLIDNPLSPSFVDSDPFVVTGSRLTVRFKAHGQTDASASFLNNSIISDILGSPSLLVTVRVTAGSANDPTVADSTPLNIPGGNSEQLIVGLRTDQTLDEFRITFFRLTKTRVEMISKIMLELLKGTRNYNNVWEFLYNKAISSYSYPAEFSLIKDESGRNLKPHTVYNNMYGEIRPPANYSYQEIDWYFQDNLKEAGLLDQYRAGHIRISKETDSEWTTNKIIRIYSNVGTRNRERFQMLRSMNNRLSTFFKSEAYDYASLLKHVLRGLIPAEDRTAAIRVSDIALTSANTYDPTTIGYPSDINGYKNILKKQIPYFISNKPITIKHGESNFALIVKMYGYNKLNLDTLSGNVSITPPTGSGAVTVSMVSASYNGKANVVTPLGTEQVLHEYVVAVYTTGFARDATEDLIYSLDFNSANILDSEGLNMFPEQTVLIKLISETSAGAIPFTIERVWVSSATNVRSATDLVPALFEQVTTSEFYDSYRPHQDNGIGVDPLTVFVQVNNVLDAGTTAGQVAISGGSATVGGTIFEMDFTSFMEQVATQELDIIGQLAMNDGYFSTETRWFSFTLDTLDNDMEYTLDISNTIENVYGETLTQKIVSDGTGLLYDGFTGLGLSTTDLDAIKAKLLAARNDQGFGKLSAVFTYHS